MTEQKSILTSNQKGRIMRNIKNRNTRLYELTEEEVQAELQEREQEAQAELRYYLSINLGNYTVDGD